jgi:hypothetical protein
MKGGLGNLQQVQLNVSQIMTFEISAYKYCISDNNILKP